MSEFEHKDNTFTLFPFVPKDGRAKKDTDPLLTGRGKIKGEAVDVAVYKNLSKDGKVYYGGQVKEPWNGGQSAQRQAPSENNQPFPPDDIPI